jgi:hypothetical protein
MKLRLRALPATVRGIYATRAGPNTLPERFRRLAPDAADALLRLEAATGGLIYTDMLRSAEESLAARKRKVGVAAPGWSGHNWGFSVDVAVEETLKLRFWKYADLLEAMRVHGWHCHRRDGAVGYRQMESWHFNYFGDDAAKWLAHAHESWSAPVEHLIEAVYGPFQLTVREAQAALAKLRMYSGDVDGLLGPITRESILAFQRAWLLIPHGVLDARTERTLLLVAADIELL